MKNRYIALAVLCTFFCTNLMIAPAMAQTPSLPWMPVAGTRMAMSPPFNGAVLTGMVVHPDNALNLDFLINPGDKPLNAQEKPEEYMKLVKYFMASLTVADSDQWVNLSPYEKNRIVEKNFGTTQMGRDLLAQDYVLKQMTASLMYPEDKLGKSFWNKVYARAKAQYGATEMPVNTFNKVWIIADKASILEKGNTVVIVNSHLKVMLEEDYLAIKKNKTGSINNTTTQQHNVETQHLASKHNQTTIQQYNNTANTASTTNAANASIIREIIIPALETEVNEGKNFAALRQVYSAMILSTWFKRALKESLLGKVYANKNKLLGVNLNDPNANAAIYQQYLKAYKKGAFNYIKEEVDQISGQLMPRKYFSGGASNNLVGVIQSLPVTPASLAMAAQLATRADSASVSFDSNSAMAAKTPQAWADEVMNSFSDLEGRIEGLSDEQIETLVTDLYRDLYSSSEFKQLVTSGIFRFVLLNQIRSKIDERNLGRRMLIWVQLQQIISKGPNIFILSAEKNKQVISWFSDLQRVFSEKTENLYPYLRSSEDVGREIFNYFERSYSYYGGFFSDAEIRQAFVHLIDLKIVNDFRDGTADSYNRAPEPKEAVWIALRDLIQGYQSADTRLIGVVVGGVDFRKMEERLHSNGDGDKHSKGLSEVLSREVVQEFLSRVTLISEAPENPLVLTTPLTRLQRALENMQELRQIWNEKLGPSVEQAALYTIRRIHQYFSSSQEIMSSSTWFNGSFMPVFLTYLSLILREFDSIMNPNQIRYLSDTPITISERNDSIKIVEEALADPKRKGWVSALLAAVVFAATIKATWDETHRFPVLADVPLELKARSATVASEEAKNANKANEANPWSQRWRNFTSRFFRPGGGFAFVAATSADTDFLDQANSQLQQLWEQYRQAVAEFEALKAQLKQAQDLYERLKNDVNATEEERQQALAKIKELEELIRNAEMLTQKALFMIRYSEQEFMTLGWFFVNFSSGQGAISDAKRAKIEKARVEAQQALNVLLNRIARLREALAQMNKPNTNLQAQGQIWEVEQEFIDAMLGKTLADPFDVLYPPAIDKTNLTTSPSDVVNLEQQDVKGERSEFEIVQALKTMLGQQLASLEAQLRDVYKAIPGVGSREGQKVTTDRMNQINVLTRQIDDMKAKLKKVDERLRQTVDTRVGLSEGVTPANVLVHGGTTQAPENGAILPNGVANRALDGTKGGIDLNGVNLDLYIKRDGKGVPLPTAQQDWAQLSQIPGFIPRIIEIKPLINNPNLLSDLR